MPDRMPGRLARPWCPHCQGSAGLDCPDRSPSPRQVRRRLKRELDRQATDVLADDQDQPERTA